MKSPSPSVSCSETQRKRSRDNATPNITSSSSEFRLSPQHEQLCDLGLNTQCPNDGISHTGSPTFSSPIIEETKRAYQDQQSIKGPLDAIELLPYSHQVGGHTTLWRFSKRAVCKQLNNRENEFYEKIEKYHPKLLQFLPRYIGVLNVTFEKQNRRKPKRKDSQDSTVDVLDVAQGNSVKGVVENAADISVDDKILGGNKTGHRPSLSQSHGSSHLQPVPTVTFANNRHIIPKSILKPQPFLEKYHNRIQSDGSSVSRMISQELSSNAVNSRISGPSVEPNPWGKTNVNKMLRDDVFNEVFLQKPIPIKHKKPATHRSTPFLKNNDLRNSNSETSLQGTHLNQSQTDPSRGKVINSVIEQKSPNETSTNVPRAAAENSSDCLREMILDDQTGRSAPEPEIAHVASTSGKRQRRYSSGGLRRRPAEVADDRGQLKYFEEADDVVFKDDTDIFSMDPEQTDGNNLLPDTIPARGAGDASQIPADPCSSSEVNLVNDAMPHSYFNSPCQGTPRPLNPKEARARQASRLEYFLLLEDLTAGMKRPCIMDLKMGTRQYGVDANHNKQNSQRKKCASTTSKELGVRVCGLQVWDVGSQDYIFKDKYYGRQLKAGDEFQKALCRFLYDGVDYSSVLRHIPSILQKLSKLETLILGLIGYRFYGTSLLIFYDGATEEECSSDSTTTGRDERRILRDIDFKIADFANCVTKEDFLLNKRTCPPQHPNQPDMGFLRGLRNLKCYFMAIQREILKEKGYVYFQDTPAGTGYEGLAENDYDEGNVSY